MLPPPPEVHLLDPRAPRERVTFGAELSQCDHGETEPDVQELREPTDVDGTLWWDDEDDEDARITERPPRFQQTH